MRKFCESLGKHAIKIIKKIKSLTKEHQEPYKNKKIYYICKQKFENKYLNYEKDKICHYTGECRGAVPSIYN